jgi:deoxyxylulose-5-phosphate synthase
MKKIGLVTLYGNNNYGNRLQNFALEKIIRSLDFECETIVFLNKNNKSLKSNYIYFKKLLKQFISKSLFLKLKKQMSFKIFSKTFLNEKFIYSNQWIPLSEQCTIQEKIRLSSILDKKCSGGNA